MSNNLQKAFLITTALYIFLGSLIAFSIINLTQINTSQSCRQVCLACFEEANLQPKQEQKHEAKKIEKAIKKESKTQQPNVSQSMPQSFEQAHTSEAQTNKTQLAQTQTQPSEKIDDKRTCSEINNGGIAEKILSRHANNSTARKALKKNISGTCNVSFVLHKNGTISEEQISNCHELLKKSVNIAIEEASTELPKPYDDCRVSTHVEYVK
jgi:outer membrane biosynthesis protein TonB